MSFPPETLAVVCTDCLPCLRMVVSLQTKLVASAGSKPLAERLQLLRPDIHVFSHTHFSWNSFIDGAPLYPEKYECSACSSCHL